MSAIESLETLARVIHSFPAVDRQKLYQIAVFLLLDHLEDGYSDKFLECLIAAGKVMHFGISILEEEGFDGPHI